MNRRGLAQAASVVLIIAVCATTGSASDSRTPRNAPKPTPTPEAEVSTDRAPLAPSEPISLDLKDADLVDVLRSFAQLARINLAVDAEVRGSVTVRLENVPWEKALEVILRPNGFGYVWEGRVLRVGLPAKLAASSSPST
ncbi:MAG TPA: secretin and TonB N-terminal domain-containing protein [Thermoanaerobaculia bacterium]